MTVKEWLNKGRKLNIEIAELKKAKDNAFVSGLRWLCRRQ